MKNRLRRVIAFALSLAIYASSSFVVKATEEDSNDNKLVVLLSDTKMYTDVGPVNIYKYTIGKIIEENDIYYGIDVNGKTGFVDKNKADILTNPYVVVDISDQKLKLFKDYVKTMDVPIVSGLPVEDRKTEEGIFKFYNITHKRDLIGKNYRVYVDVMMKFDAGRGCHDSSYHTCEGKTHGWRNESEFGGEIYKTDGSHGCINMRHDDAIELDENIDIGTNIIIRP